MFWLGRKKNKTAASVEGRGCLISKGDTVVSPRPHYTATSANLQLIGMGDFMMEEILKLQEVIVSVVRKITSQSKLQRILRLVQHLYIR